jgi:hypothetical protein
MLPVIVYLAVLAGLVAASDSADWPCDVRVWTRAPDLSPNSIIPGEARLAANGTGCVDMISWSVGLRYKERAIIKIRFVIPKAHS